LDPGGLLGRLRKGDGPSAVIEPGGPLKDRPELRPVRSSLVFMTLMRFVDVSDLFVHPINVGIEDTKAGLATSYWQSRPAVIKHAPTPGNNAAAIYYEQQQRRKR
jgi:hypothetical protein